MRYPAILAATALLAGCSQSNPAGETTQSFDVAEAPARPAVAGAAVQPVAVAVAQIAYVYRYGFTLPGDAVRRTLAAHVALCDRLGPARCQVLGMSSDSADGDRDTATLTLRVDSGIARAFGDRLERTAAGAGGRTGARSITAEDVSKAIVDTEARLRQRTILVQRLTEVLATRRGTVAELVEAERGVAAAQEELDQARGWLGELRGRVATSKFELGYNAVAASTRPGFGGSLGEAVARSASVFVGGATALLALVIVLAPWALLAGLVWLGWRRLRRRWPSPRRADDPPV